MLKDKKSFFGKILIFAVALVWGASFFLLRDSLDVYPLFFVLAIRFFISGLLLLAIFFKRIVKMGKKNFFRGVLMGLVLTLGYIVQTYGLKISGSPSKNAFLTACYCMFVPFMAWAFLKKKPTVFNIIAAVMCLVGIGLISLSSDFSVNIGDMLSLLGSVFFALQIILGDKFIKDTDPYALVSVEVLTVGVICAVISPILESGQYASMRFPVDMVFILLYLSLACTLGAQVSQIVGQKYVAPSDCALLLSLEGVFGALFGVLLGGDVLTVKLVIGFVLIFFAEIIGETGLKFLKRKKDD